MPKLEEGEIKKYWQIFQGLKPTDNKLSGDKMSPVLKNSHLTETQLTQIWDMADIDMDGSLDFEEFCIAMRLVFDLVNGNITSVPSTLPGWLIPGSKQHLIQAKNAIESNTTGFSDSSDDDYQLSSDFDWYLSPTDKTTYESIYSSSCDRYGRIKFDSLSDLYKTLEKVPETDISSAWNLVNPKQFVTIDKDQCLVFLHILNQRSNGKRVPRSVPASLRATFSKEAPDYNVDSHQGDIKTNGADSRESNTKKSFGEGYLNKLGTSKSNLVKSGTDFSATKGTEWEEVQLKRELQDLEDLIKKAEYEKSNKGNDDRLGLVKYEFEQLLKYKESQAQELSKHKNADFASILGNVEMIESQISQLELFLQKKNKDLEVLNSQLEALK
ncbi:unnamed protein product [Ambrosiozyma monospora]|uniref:Actin cytoskeleton-regulatory complex protein END3 n=1 Tax=Ambrosiozyma monospora TaxID=43982 RepID=A0A9W6YP99_AMBMO|nr:unnamed protein product [Ambrosiozyma monospora]